MAAHKHAALMAEIARRAQTSDKPWEGLQFRFDGEGGEWLSIKSEPAFHPYMEYRWAPRTRTVELPLGMTETPIASYYTVEPFTPHVVVKFPWFDSEGDRRLLQRGMCYATREDAEAAARALGWL